MNPIYFGGQMSMIKVRTNLTFSQNSKNGKKKKKCHFCFDFFCSRHFSLMKNIHYKLGNLATVLHSKMYCHWTKYEKAEGSTSKTHLPTLGHAVDGTKDKATYTVDNDWLVLQFWLQGDITPLSLWICMIFFCPTWNFFLTWYLVDYKIVWKLCAMVSSPWLILKFNLFWV